ncbi:hypothetical protein [uncultured Sphingobium sp.]|uniref:hypothetical protein n=1 Tax=uncultured Sphingobium sp. TaxID=316087 RepID=UPI00259BD94F|nr:hypothetical protein [uncultured Sphingobium sp.]
MNSEWTPGVIMTQTSVGKVALPGWVSDPFGLDWALDSKTGSPVWMVHHLPTGYSLMAVDHEIAGVLQLVDLLRSLGDWSFTDASGVSEFLDTLAIVRASGFTVFSPLLRCGRPTMPNQLTGVAA